MAVSENDAVFKCLIPPQPPNREGFLEAFKALLGNPELMAGGGMLAFGSRHVYPIDDSLKYVYDVLKGSDAVVYQVCVRSGLTHNYTCTTNRKTQTHRHLKA